MEYEGETFHLTEYQINKTIKAFKYLDKKKRGLLKFEYAYIPNLCTQEMRNTKNEMV